jgi:hypothetical protein
MSLLRSSDESLKAQNSSISNDQKTQNELPRSKLTEYQNIAMRIYPKGVTPECFNRGSSSGLAWIPDRSIRE